MKYVLSFLIFALQPIRAQQSADKQESTKATGRSAWFIYSRLPETVTNPVKILSGKSLVEVTLSKRQPSQPVKIPQDGKLSVVREEPNPEKPDEKILVALAQAQVPEGMQKALIILIPLDKPNAGKVFTTRIQSLSEFRGGDWLFLNLTNAEIGIQFGSEKTLVKSGGTGIRENRSITESTNIPFSYHFRTPGEQEWKLLTASTAVVMPSRREICIFSVNPQNGRIAYDGITFPFEQ